MKIAFVARTKGLEYDDRIRKECISLSKKNQIVIFTNFEDNRAEEGVTSYGIAYRSFRLATRDKLPSAKYLFIKAFEFYLKLYPILRQFDVVWAHEEYTFMFPLFARRNRCIWDLHEIPFRFEKKGMRNVFGFIERKSKKIIHANNYRITYLKKEGVIKDLSAHAFIRNLPDEKFLESTGVDPNYQSFREWLNGSDYAYLQGLTVPRRYPFNTVEAIMRTLNLKAIVVGNFDKKAHQKLKEKYGNTLNDKIYFAGLVNQLDIPAYLKDASFSIVLYDTKTPNNRYCEPNRLYQSIVLKVPVIVGCNEPMREIVDVGNYGINLSSDGGDLDEVVNAIIKLLKDHEYYSRNAAQAVNEFLWDDSCIKESWYG